MANPTAELFVKVGADVKGLKTGLDSAEKKVGGFANTIKKHHKAIGMAMTAMGAAILAAGALSVKAFAKMGDEVQKMALRTGFSTEALSELRHAADLSGTSLSSLEKASKTLSGAILDAGFGLETYIRAFDKIGLSYEKLKPLSPEEQFLAVMEALAGLTDESERAALAADLFGRAGTQLLPMLVDGADGLAAMRQEAHDLGIVFDQEAANKAAEFNDALTKLKGSVSGVMMEVGEFLVDALKPLIDWVTEAIKKFSDWSKEHESLSKVVTYLGTAMGGLLVALGAVLFMLPQLIAAYKLLAAVKWATIIPAVWAFVTALWAQVTATLAAMAATGVLIPAAIAAVAAIALITTGITLLIKNQREQIEVQKEMNEEVDEGATRWRVIGAGATEYFDTLEEAQEEATRRQEEINKGLLREIKLRDSLTESLRKTYATTFMAYEALAGKRELTAFEREQRAAFGKMVGIPGYQTGGIVTKPTLAMVGERGPEAIVPLDKGMGGITINFTEPVFMEREESINKLADRIYRVIKREQRLSFGGAYGG